MTIKIIGKLYRHCLEITSSKFSWFYKILYILPRNIVVVNGRLIHNPLNYFLQKTFATISRNSSATKIINRAVTFKYNNKSTFKMKLNINEYTQCLYYFGSPNPDLLKLINSGGKGFLDIGANVGFFSLYASQHFKEVVSFEPTPHTYRKLEQNISLSNLSNLKPINAALSEKEGSMKLYSCPYNQGGNKLGEFSEEIKIEHKNMAWEYFDVDVHRLDDLESGNVLPSKIDLIKIDVEGHEALVFKGAQSTLAKHKPVIYAEVASSRENLNNLLNVLPIEYKAYNPISGKEIFENSIVPFDVVLRF